MKPGSQSASYLQTERRRKNFFPNSIYQQTSQPHISKPPVTLIANEAALSGGQVTGDR